MGLQKTVNYAWAMQLKQKVTNTRKKDFAKMKLLLKINIKKKACYYGQ